MNNALWTKIIQDVKPLAFLGRYSKETPDASLRWPLSGVELMIRCTQLLVEIDADITDQAPWAAVFCDDALIARFPVAKGRYWYPVLMGMDISVPHKIAIVNDTQPMGSSAMHMKICALKSDGELLELPEPAYHFEFIGDSLTTGEGCAGPRSANEWKAVWMCPSNGYAHMTSAFMNARASLISQSGWGVYCGWDGTLQYNIPRIYDQLCGVIPEGQIPYDFSQKMDAVIINLGTNDVGALKSLPEDQRKDRAELLIQSTAAFLKKIRLHNPDAYLLWVYGMCSQDWMACFQEGVERARAAGDDRIGFCPLPPCTKEDTGSRMHPGSENHKIAAMAIVDHLKSVLK